MCTYLGYVYLSRLCVPIHVIAKNTVALFTLQVVQLGYYTSASDVWSYGVLLYETFSCGKVPYFEISNKVCIV